MLRESSGGLSMIEPRITARLMDWIDAEWKRTHPMTPIAIPETATSSPVGRDKDPSSFGSTDRELRIRCLEFAHQGDKVGRPLAELVKRAKAFEAYVKGEE